MDAINQPLLDVRDLSVAFGNTLAVDQVSFSVKRGECVALVGESGSGKSVSALSILKLLPYPSASHPSGHIRFRGRELLTAAENEMREIRGNDISIIFQEPMTSLNPLHTIEAQIGEILLLHSGISGQTARARTLELLTQVGIPDPETRLKSYPHQLSGGQRQRVMIAMALANEPDLLIADEPTTALDVTVQAQILALLAEIRSRLGMSMLFITHDLGIVRRIADVVCVMNSGKIVEQGPVEQVFTAPKHAYTRALLAAEPKPDPAPPRPNEPVVISADNLKVWFPIKRGLLRSTVGHIKAVDGVSIRVRKRETRVVKALRDVGLDPETRFRYPHEFSGGQRQRISIARAVVLEPNFVVLDEPTSALDMLFQAQMVDLLRELQRKRDLTYMFISHDLRVVASLASHLIVMRHGKVVEEGPAAELFKNPKSDYTRALFAAAFRIEAVPDL